MAKRGPAAFHEIRPKSSYRCVSCCIGARGLRIQAHVGIGARGPGTDPNLPRFSGGHLPFQCDTSDCATCRRQVTRLLTVPLSIPDHAHVRSTPHQIVELRFGKAHAFRPERWLLIVGGSLLPALVLLAGSAAIAWARRDQL